MAKDTIFYCSPINTRENTKWLNLLTIEIAKKNLLDCIGLQCFVNTYNKKKKRKVCRLCRFKEIQWKMII